MDHTFRTGVSQGATRLLAICENKCRGVCSHRLLQGAQTALFLLISGAIVGVGSERMFWYWSTNPLDHLEIAVAYGLAVGGVLWAVQQYKVNSLGGLMLAAPLFAYVVEGVITPILYTAGPFVPFFPAWFTFWHGFISLVGLWYLLHLWLVRGRAGRVALASGGLGVFWGLWSVTMWLPENVNDAELVETFGPLELLGPRSFARYVFTFSVLLAAMHSLWGRVVSPTAFRPSRWSKRLYLALVAVILVVWTVSIPWALPMFAAYVALQLWLLRRQAPGATGPGLLEQLSGQVQARDLLALTPLPVAASGTYALAWQLQPPMVVIRWFMYTVIGVQAALAVFAIVKLARRQSVRRSAVALLLTDSGSLGPD